MFIIGNLIIAIAKVLSIVLSLVYWMILIRALVSWVNPDPYNAIIQFLYRTTEPILEPIRRVLPQMGFDVSPIIAFLGIVFLQNFVVTSMLRMGMSLQ